MQIGRLFSFFSPGGEIVSLCVHIVLHVQCSGKVASIIAAAAYQARWAGSDKLALCEPLA